MSGGLLYNFRQGNRSELLADYLLSSIGITTPVRRQDDYGFDFYCQLSDQEDGYLTFGYPFIIQIKSDPSDPIEYGQKNFEKWKPENIAWLFRNELPFFIGIVDKEAISISIYDTTGLWQVYNKETFHWSQIQLKPVLHIKGQMRENCQESKIDDWQEGKGDGLLYTVDLGNPIITLTYNDLKNQQGLKEKKAILRSIVVLEQQNIIHRNLGIRGFNEIKENITNEGLFITGMALNPRPSEDVSKIYSSLRVGLISLLVNLASQERTDECTVVKNLLKHVPKADYYDQLYKQSEGLFDWTRDAK